jgi:hypothetical protein
MLLLLIVAIAYLIRVAHRVDRRMAAYERVREIADWPNGNDPPPHGRHLHGLPPGPAAAVGLTLAAAAALLGIVASSPWNNAQTSVRPPVALPAPITPPPTPTTTSASLPVETPTAEPPPAALVVTASPPRRARPPTTPQRPGPLHGPPTVTPRPVGLPDPPTPDVPSIPNIPSTASPACLVNVDLRPLLAGCLI